MLQDLKFAFRSFARRRGFFLVAMLTVALGVALTTTTFSVADNLLFKPLPYLQPDRLFEVFGAARQEKQLRIPAAIGDQVAWRETGAFSGIGAFIPTGAVSLAGGREPRRVGAAAVDEHFLETLGVQSLLGRAIRRDDCREGATPVALISVAMWRRELGGSPEAVGRLIDVNNVSTQIVGVLPADFLFPALSPLDPSSQPPLELLLPLVIPAVQAHDHNRRGYRAIGRLAPGISQADAQARLDAAQQAVRSFYRPSNVIPGAFDGVTMTPLAASLRPRGADSAVLYLFLAALAVLLVSAVNVANMLLARGAEREREMTVRLAIGASRSRLARLLLVEAVTLSTIGGGLGLLLSRGLFGLVLTELPPRFMGVRDPVFDLRIALFAWAISLIVGTLFGLAPAVRLSRPRFGHVIGQAVATSTPRGQWTRDVLIFSEVSLAIVLVGAGALVLKSFANVMRIDPGMDPHDVLTLQVTAPQRNAVNAGSDRAGFFRGTLDAARSLPGVRHAAVIDSQLISGGYRGTGMSVAGIETGRLWSGGLVTEVHVTSEYFAVLGIPVLRGSGFTPQARSDDAAAIVSEQLERTVGSGLLGRELVSSFDPAARHYRIVGIVKDVRDHGLEPKPTSTLYLPFTESGTATLLVRGENPAALAGPLSQRIHAFEPRAVVDQVRTLDDLVQRSVAERRFNAFVYGMFSLSALGLTTIGVYGVIAYNVSRRTREIGIRVALGATGQRVVALVARRVLVVLACGLLAGYVGLAALRTTLRSLLFGLRPNDPLTLTLATTLLIGTAVAAAYIPARRAARVDPMIALRAE